LQDTPSSFSCASSSARPGPASLPAPSSPTWLHMSSPPLSLPSRSLQAPRHLPLTCSSSWPSLPSRRCRWPWWKGSSR